MYAANRYVSALCAWLLVKMHNATLRHSRFRLIRIKKKCAHGATAPLLDVDALHFNHYLR